MINTEITEIAEKTALIAAQELPKHRITVVLPELAFHQVLACQNVSPEL